MRILSALCDRPVTGNRLALIPDWPERVTGLSSPMHKLAA